MKISSFNVLSFDCYGTLIDWETGITKALLPLTSRLKNPPDRDMVLQAHAFHESRHQALSPAKPYTEILKVVYRRLAEEWGLTVTVEECETYGHSVRYWPAFPDSQKALLYLKQHFKLVILSNIDHQSFAHSNKKLGVDFDAVFTAEDIGAYKPDRSNFEYMLGQLKRMGYSEGEILHVAESMFHDHEPAQAMGISTCHIFRRHDQNGFGATRAPEKMPPVNMTFNDLQSFADKHTVENE